MDVLRIKGLRSLIDTGPVRLAPITVLLGENSSGKSTFLRTLPLLRQSVEVPTSEPLLWYGRLVDFGSFDESASKAAQAKCVELELTLQVDPNFAFRHSPYFEASVTSACQVTFSVVGGKAPAEIDERKRVESYVNHLELRILGTTIDLELSAPRVINRLLIDDHDFTNAAKASFGITKGNAPIPTLYPLDIFDESDEENPEKPGPRPLNFEQLVHQHVKLHVHNRTKDDSIDALISRIRLGTLASMLDTIKSSQAQQGIWRKHVNAWTINSEELKVLQRLLWGARLESLLDSLSDSMRREFLAISYITPLRAAAERYYRQQGLAVNELDAKGENFAPFLRSLSYDDRSSLKEWLTEALGVYVQLIESPGHVSLHLVDGKSGSWVNLADTGFGYSQLLPIAVQLWLMQKRRLSVAASRRLRTPVVVIEQPELHLHPRIQAKVADILSRIASTKDGPSKAHLIVETHSEALVNRLGRLIAIGELKPDDVNVVLFEKRGFDQPTLVQSTQFDESGFLQNWPLGFFSSES